MIALALLAAATAAQPPSTPQASLVEQARATVRILPAARVAADEVPPEAMVKVAEFRRDDGSTVKSRLVEFP